MSNAARGMTVLGGVRDVAHRVRLPRARLPVREHRLVPAEDVVDHGRERPVEHLLCELNDVKTLSNANVAERPRALRLITVTSFSVLAVTTGAVP